MKSYTRGFWFYRTPGRFWLRVFGYGICGKDLRQHGLSYSERRGIFRRVVIGNWSLTWLPRFA